MPAQGIIAPNAYKPRAVHAVKVGDFVYTTGVYGAKPDGTLADDFESQCDQTWKNITNILAAAGAKPEQIFNVTQFVAKREDFPKFFEIRAKYLNDPTDSPPTRGGYLGVADLGRRLLIECMVIAYTGD